MKTISKYIAEAGFDALNAELHIGDFVEFDSSKITIFAVIKDISKDENPIYTFIPFGCRGTDISKIKNQYRIRENYLKRVWTLNIDDNIKELILKKLNISIN